ncbi:helix-turn-helix transcriptional regulator [Sphaerisporangium sp. NPDC051017]|uniref:helix-turn-helix domain-containing protein n=1 Tax=Sphaerisporangium sp. NPDC051017 TaxID=3154636 RepID=UPI003422157B
MPRRAEPVDPAASSWHLLGATLRHWRDDMAKLTQQETAARALCDGGDLSKWERGLARPQADTVARLDALFGADGQLVALHANAVELERLRARTLEKEVPVRDEEGDMHRRTAMRLIAAISAGVAIPPGTLEALTSGVERAAVDHQRLGVEDWEEIAWEHAHNWVVSSPGSLIGAVTMDIAEISRLLERNPSPVMRDGLLRTSAQLGTILAVELGDVGENSGNSLTMWRMARRAADASGDRGLRVWVRAREAYFGAFANRPLAVVDRLADDAIRIADGKPGAGLVRATNAKAMISAMLGDAGRTRAALDDLDKAFELLPDDVNSDHTSPIWGYPERNHHWHHACVSALIGDTRKASQAIEQALALFPADHHGDIANVHMARALTLVHDRDVADGLDDALVVAQTYPLSATRRRIANQIVNALPDKAHSLPAAQELRTLTA